MIRRSLAGRQLLRGPTPPIQRAASPPSPAEHAAAAAAVPASSLSAAVSAGRAAPPPISGGEAAEASARETRAEEAAWRRRIAENVEDVQAHVSLSKSLLRRRRASEAVAHLWPAVKAVPQGHSAPIRFQLGVALSVQGQHEPAELLFEQALELEPGFTEGWLCLGSCREELGKPALAAQALERAAALRPDELGEWSSREVARLRALAEAAEGGDGEKS